MTSPGPPRPCRRSTVEARPDGLLPGYRRCYADDCFGNRLEFLTPSASSR